MSLDENGYGRIEKMSYDAYDESAVLVDTIKRFKERTGDYPERVLVNQIYRTRANLRFCKENGIRISGPKLGRPAKVISKAEQKQVYQDNTDRIEVERSFSTE